MSVAPVNSFYGDTQALSGLRRAAATESEGALEAVAEQFEALFVQMMFKSMRDAGFGGGVFDSQQMQTYYEMFDKQVSLEMARGRGLGLADMLVRQLDPAAVGHHPSTGNAPVALNARAPDLLPPPVRSPGTKPDVSESLSAGITEQAAGARAAAFASREEFIATLRPLAEQAAARLDVPARAIVAQSALETGWGQHIMQHPDGRPAWALFGIKAGPDWQGDVVQARTMEVIDGELVQETARFRAYSSPAAAVADYVHFLAERSRYDNVLGTGEDVSAFARALQQAGYATDPEYADKIRRISERLASEGMPQVLASVAATNTEAGRAEG
jgi:peptidoglycan hydrolase FlgJ